MPTLTQAHMSIPRTHSNTQIHTFTLMRTNTHEETSLTISNSYSSNIYNDYTELMLPACFKYLIFENYLNYKENVTSYLVN